MKNRGGPLRENCHLAHNNEHRLVHGMPDVILARSPKAGASEDHPCFFDRIIGYELAAILVTKDAI